MDMREKYSTLIRQAFQRDQNMEIAMKQAFEQFINVNNKTA
jgi:hypothetical protein